MAVNKQQMRLTSCSLSILMKSTSQPWREVLIALITRSSFLRPPVTGQEEFDSAFWNVCHFATPGMLQRKAVWYQICVCMAPLVFRLHLFVSTGGSLEKKAVSAKLDHRVGKLQVSLQFLNQKWGPWNTRITLSSVTLWNSNSCFQCTDRRSGDLQSSA